MTDSILSQNDLCVKCKKRARQEGLRYCAPCLERYRIQRAHLRANSFCLSCGNGVLSARNQTLCVPCGHKARQKRARRVLQARQSGLCTRCGKRPRLVGYKKCQNCRKAEVAYHDNADRAAKCCHCHKRNRADGFTTCQYCLDKHRARNEAKKEQGLCRYSANCRNRTENALAYCEFHRQRGIERNTARRYARRKLVIDTYGGRCNCCGENEFKFLAIDHVNGGGQKEGAFGPFLVRRVIVEGFPERFQILCHNCNHAKGIYGTCPHKTADLVI